MLNTFTRCALNSALVAAAVVAPTHHAFAQAAPVAASDTATVLPAVTVTANAPPADTLRVDKASVGPLARSTGSIRHIRSTSFRSI
ncbi:hypothetical protein [Paraburkholderia sp.]|uniref:hypothetical protein n=1 Tax=Paraburkholderia sp. TaxID=1926495 RepID=UPI0023A24434|nr:hypothetical protein [Paraburkholderia sp.]MDE1180565.1 hypothetical protein [Paraburkholderia sp.]